MRESKLDNSADRRDFITKSFAFKNWYIRYIKGLEAEIYKDKFLEI